MIGETVTKNPATAGALSFLMPGLGQVYNGEVGKAVLLWAIQIVNVLLMFVVVGFVTYPAVWLYGIWDAYNTAKTAEV